MMVPFLNFEATTITQNQRGKVVDEEDDMRLETIPSLETILVKRNQKKYIHGI